MTSSKQCAAAGNLANRQHSESQKSLLFIDPAHEARWPGLQFRQAKPMLVAMEQGLTSPDRQRSLAQYRLRAGVYDSELAVFEPIRCSAIARLELALGDTVLDAGCGTGLSFEPLQRAVGTGGSIIGVEQSTDMLNKAQARVTERGWSNVTLLNTPAELATTPMLADAAMFHFTHDILRNPEAICNLVHCLKPGARVVAAGLQWANPWAFATNWCVMLAAMYSTTSLEGLDQPWSHLADYLSEFEVSTTSIEGVYIASGVLAKSPATASASLMPSTPADKMPPA
jgi:SAM-dependent methyltransferase